MTTDVRVPDRLRRHVRRQVRGYYVGLVGYSLVVGTALGTLLGAAAVGPIFGGLIGSTLVERWRWWRRREQYLTEIEVRAALRTGTDPRPELMLAAQHEARETIRELPVVVGAVCVIFGILALACAVAAVIRDDVLVALPAAPCVAGAVWGLVRLRAARARAQRWLADHLPTP